jgi:hypothetical protein
LTLHNFFIVGENMASHLPFVTMFMVYGIITEKTLSRKKGVELGLTAWLGHMTLEQKH